MSNPLRSVLAGLFVVGLSLMDPVTAAPVALGNPVVFVTQPPIPRELNSSVSNTFLSVVTLFGNQQSDTAHAGRGGDLWLMTTNGGLVNLTRRGGFGAGGVQHGAGIDVRDPAIHWSGKKVLFSMVVGSPTNAADTTRLFWQLHELTNLDAVIADTNTLPVIVPVANQPTNFNNVTPCYATDDRVVFMSDRPFNNQPWLYPQLDEYKGAPTVTGTYSLDPTTGDLRLLQHLPSGGFNPFVDSYGRLIVTRWDHLSQDPNAVNDRIGRATNGSLNFLSEAANSAIQSGPVTDTFPEPRKFDTNALALLGVNGNDFNLFLPWELDETGGNEEILNHVGRHELSPSMVQSFKNDSSLVSFTNYAARPSYGIATANTNFLNAFLQITEDPRTNGLYWGVDAQDISIFGGTHSGGQILTLTGGAGLNPTGMVINYITPKNGANGPNALGVFRNPLPMSDGALIAAFTPTPTSMNFGFDTNIGTASAPLSRYRFRLMTLAKSGALWTTNQFLTAGLTNVSIYWDGATLVTNAGPLWELQPVEVRARPVPTPVHTGVDPIESRVFTEENVDLPTFQADLSARGLALVISRNVTSRDAADKQQPFNLAVPGGASSLGTTGKVYGVTHLQFLQADYLRGYDYGTGTVQPGRRVLPEPMHDAAAFNYRSRQPNAPVGGTEIMADGSQATFVPAGRAVTWQLTGTNHNDSVVKERYWLTFRPGEVRTCANCHGINAADQAGQPKPANAPQALRELLRFWRTNSANALSLTVSNGTGGGSFGAGSRVMLTAAPAPAGKVFVKWSGPGIGNVVSPTVSFIMPTNSATVTANYADLASPVISGTQWIDPSNLKLVCAALADQPWVLQGSVDLSTWTDLATNLADGLGLLQFTNAAAASPPLQFFRVRSP